MNIPIIFGDNSFRIDECNDFKNDDSNILYWIDDMTQNFALSLTNEEKKLIMSTFIDTLKVDSILNCWNKDELPIYNAAIADLKAVKSHLITISPHYGQAKWSYAQFIEKILKSWLIKGGMSHSDVVNLNHNIKKLAKAFNEMYGTNIKNGWVRKINSEQAFRYDEKFTDPTKIYNIQQAVFDTIIEIGENPVQRENL